jgi:hypothetical protein
MKHHTALPEFILSLLISLFLSSVSSAETAKIDSLRALFKAFEMENSSRSIVKKIEEQHGTTITMEENPERKKAKQRPLVGQVSPDKNVIFRYAGKRPQGNSERSIYRIS